MRKELRPVWHAPARARNDFGAHESVPPAVPPRTARAQRKRVRELADDLQQGDEPDSGSEDGALRLRSALSLSSLTRSLGRRLRSRVAQSGGNESDDDDDAPQEPQEAQATARAQRTPMLANDLKTPLARLAVIDCDHFPGALQALLARTPCVSCARVGSLSANASCVALVAVLVVSCSECNHQERMHGDELWGKRYAANYKFVFSGFVMAQSFSVVKAPLQLCGFSLPNETHSAYSSFRENLAEEARIASEKNMEEQRLALRDAARRAVGDGDGTPEVSVSVDGQYPTTQGAATPKGAVSAMIDTRSRKVVDVAFSHPSEPATLAFKLKAGLHESRATPLLRLTEPPIMHCLKYNCVEYRQYEVRCALALLDRLQSWPDGDSVVTVIADEHVTVRSLIESLGFVYCLDIFHRVTKLRSDLHKFVQKKSLVAATSPRLSAAQVDSLGAQLVVAFKESAKASRGQKATKFRAIVPNLRDLDRENVVAVACITEFVNDYAAYLSLTENVDEPYTSANESLHSHNLRVFSKRVYQPVMWETKCRCSILSWNLAPKWTFELFRDTMKACLGDNVARKLSMND